MVDSIGLRFWGGGVDRLGETTRRVRRLIVFDLKRGLSGQFGKLIEVMEQALKIPPDVLEGCLVEVGRRFVQRSYARQLVPEIDQTEHRSHRAQRAAQVL